MAEFLVERGVLIRLCESRRTRIVTFTAEMPCRWQPRQFTDPRSRQAFTDEGAWTYIVRCLKDGVDIEELILKRPPGAKAYVLYLPGVNAQKIYVKLQMCGGRVIGRSFHESDKTSFQRSGRTILRGSRCQSR